MSRVAELSEMAAGVVRRRIENKEAPRPVPWTGFGFGLTGLHFTVVDITGDRGMFTFAMREQLRLHGCDAYVIVTEAWLASYAKAPGSKPGVPPGVPPGQPMPSDNPNRQDILMSYAEDGTGQHHFTTWLVREEAGTIEFEPTPLPPGMDFISPTFGGLLVRGRQ